MTPEQREAALRLADELARIHGHRTALETIALLRELAAEPVQEPVIAVVTTSHDYGATIDWTLNPLPTGTELFTHPPQQRRPLTGQQILDGFVITCPPNASLETFEAGVRFAERAHGITGETP